MDVSISAYGDRSLSDGLAGQLSVEISPLEAVKRQSGHWRGLRAEAVQITGRETFECRFKGPYHLLIATEQSARHDGETVIDGLPTSTLHDLSHKLTFVPAGRTFFGWQAPRTPKRSVYLYLDPEALPVDPGLDFAATEFQPRLYFDDAGLWQTVLKLKPLIGSVDASARMYGEALGGVLAHELMRLNGAAPAPVAATRGGLAGWQQKRAADFIEEHLADPVSLNALAGLVHLSPYHFLRSFKHSFGEPPYRYYTVRRIERAKGLLAAPGASVSQIAFRLGFSGTSAFTATFHRITGQTPTDYRRSLQ